MTIKLRCWFNNNRQTFEVFDSEGHLLHGLSRVELSDNFANGMGNVTAVIHVPVEMVSEKPKEYDIEPYLLTTEDYEKLKKEHGIY